MLEDEERGGAYAGAAPERIREKVKAMSEAGSRMGLTWGEPSLVDSTVASDGAHATVSFREEVSGRWLTPGPYGEESCASVVPPHTRHAAASLKLVGGRWVIVEERDSGVPDPTSCRPLAAAPLDAATSARNICREAPAARGLSPHLPPDEANA